MLVVLDFLGCFLRPQVLYHIVGAYQPTSLERFGSGVASAGKPRVVFLLNELSFVDELADRQPPVPDVVVLAEKFQPFPSQTKPFDDVVHFLGLPQAAGFWLLIDDHVDIDVGVDERSIGGLLDVSLEPHQAVLLHSL